MMIRFLFTLVALATAVSAQYSNNNFCQLEQIDLPDPNFILYMAYTGNQLSVQLSHTNPDSWLALGFSPDGNMIGSTAVIGTASNGQVQVYSLDAKSPTGVVTLDNAPALFDTSITSQWDTGSFLTFTMEVNDSIALATVDNERAANYLIFAVGSGSLGYHASRGIIELPPLQDCRQADNNQVAENLANEEAAANEEDAVAEEEDANEQVVVDESPAEEEEDVVVLDVCSTELQTVDLLDEDFTLALFYNINDDTLTIELTHENSDVWIAFGFSPDGNMIGSTAVLSLDQNIEFYELSAKSNNGVQPADTPPADLVDASVDTTDGTTLRFTMSVVDFNTNNSNGIFLATTDSGLDETTQNHFIYAIGTSNELGYHARRGVISLPLIETCVPVGDPSPYANDEAEEEDELAEEEEDDAADNVVDNEFENGACLLSAPIALRDDLTLEQAVDEANDSYTMTLTYTGRAWLGIGPSSNGRMVNNHAVIGLPDAGTVQEHFLAAKSVPGVAPIANQDGVLNSAISQNNTHTVLSFTRALAPAGQLAVASDSSNTFIYAIGSGNTLGFHAIFSSFSLQLTPCGDPANGPQEAGAIELLAGGANEKSKRMFWAHGFFMAAAWGFLVPFAIGSSLLRKYISSPGMWFMIHRGSNLLGLLFTIVAFGLAISAINNNTGPGEDAQHFDGNVILHRRIGLVIFIMAMLQGLNGLLRPHAPAAAAHTEEKKSGNSDSSEDAEGGAEGTKTTKAAVTTAEPKCTARKVWEIMHRLIGLVTLVLAWYNCSSGIKRYVELYSGNSTVVLIIFWIFALGISIPSLCLGIYSRVKKE